ncbi:MAG: type II toxin-antitoxin system HicA family toxin [Candidatus Hadarchaeota archaeon]
MRLKKRNEKVFIVVVPDHPEVAKGTLRSILRRANLSVEEFLELAKK